MVKHTAEQARNIATHNWEKAFSSRIESIWDAINAAANTGQCSLIFDSIHYGWSMYSYNNDGQYNLTENMSAEIEKELKDYGYKIEIIYVGCEGYKVKVSW